MAVHGAAFVMAGVAGGVSRSANTGVAVSMGRIICPSAAGGKLVAMAVGVFVGLLVAVDLLVAVAVGRGVAVAVERDGSASAAVGIDGFVAVATARLVAAVKATMAGEVSPLCGPPVIMVGVAVSTPDTEVTIAVVAVMEAAIPVASSPAVG